MLTSTAHEAADDVACCSSAASTAAHDLSDVADEAGELVLLQVHPTERLLSPWRGMIVSLSDP